MSKKVLGYLIRHGFIPFKESAFLVEADANTTITTNSIIKRGNIVTASFISEINGLNTVKISVPEGLRPKERTEINVNGSGSGAATCVKGYINIDGTVEFLAGGNIVSELVFIQLFRTYWETED